MSTLLKLADDFSTGQIDVAGISQLEQLLAEGIAHQQAFILFTDLNASMERSVQGLTTEEAVVDHVISLSANKQALAARRQRWRQLMLGIAASTVACVLFVGAALFFSTALPLETLGHVVALSDDAKWKTSENSVGSTVHADQEVTLIDGLASIKLRNGVLVDLVGPVTLSLESLELISLSEGTVAAQLSEQAQQLTVSTFDANVVDLGTKFIVERTPEAGTNVAVLSGNVEARLKSTDGSVSKIVGLSSGRSAILDAATGRAEEVGNLTQLFDHFTNIRRLRGGIDRLEGNVRSTSVDIKDLSAGMRQAADHVLVVAEKSGVEITEPLTLNTLEGPVVLPVGTKVDSYLLHHDPTKTWVKAGIGAIVFHQPVLAVVTETDELNRLDAQFASPELLVTNEDFRGLELEDDEISLSADRKTVSFRFHVGLPNYYDHVRVLVKHAQTGED
ncbi:FecR domain-containing protein [Calycomorphotria hydatis]|nr:FecR domain-containing protein [Calycomorphotria hydatis]